MDEKPDPQLLREYAEHRSEAAFRELVHRYTDLVYSAALRQVISSDAARDVAQEVFFDLAAKAKVIVGKSAGEASLAGWLFRSTRFAALNHLRDERRRTERERQVMEQTDLAPAPEPEWERIRPVLDDAMSDLNETDRDALLLRFFKNRDFRTIGESLGLSDDAAQKRVSRALEKLRAEFARRGVTTSALALSASLSANAVTVAPTGFAVALSTSALTGTTLINAATVTATKAVATAALQKIFVAAMFVVLAGAGIFEARQASQLRVENESLQQQVVQLKSENLSNRLANVIESKSPQSEQFNELLRLRDETGRLRNELREAMQMKDRSVQVDPVRTPASNSISEFGSNVAKPFSQRLVNEFVGTLLSVDKHNKTVSIGSGSPERADPDKAAVYFLTPGTKLFKGDVPAALDDGIVGQEIRYGIRLNREENRVELTVLRFKASPQ